MDEHPSPGFAHPAACNGLEVQHFLIATLDGMHLRDYLALILQLIR